jgi:hypothetical protein
MARYERTAAIRMNLTGFHVTINPVFGVQSRSMFLMVPPTLSLTIRPLFNPLLKPVLPKPP